MSVTYFHAFIHFLIVNRTKYDRIFSKLPEMEPAFNPTSTMVDFEKTSMNALIDSISGCFSLIAKHLQKNPN